jgi:uncharacterized membrane protein
MPSLLPEDGRMTAIEITQWVLRAAIAVGFVGMGVNHFRPGPAKLMAKIIPPSLRFGGVANPANLVRFTGVCEVLGGVGILLPQVRWLTAVALVVFLIAVFPANAFAAQHPERFGSIAIPFWPRYLAQLALILAVVLAGL